MNKWRVVLVLISLAAALTLLAPVVAVSRVILSLDEAIALGVVLEMTCIALRTGDCDEGVKQAIATKLIDLAKAGERNPDLMCERVLDEIRRPQG